MVGIYLIISGVHSSTFLGGGLKHFWNFYPDPWGSDPI